MRDSVIKPKLNSFLKGYFRNFISIRSCCWIFESRDGKERYVDKSIWMRVINSISVFIAIDHSYFLKLVATNLKRTILQDFVVFFVTNMVLSLLYWLFFMKCEKVEKDAIN